MVPLNLTYLHCLQHSLFEHIFNLYYKGAQLEFIHIPTLSRLKTNLILVREVTLSK